MPTTGARSRMSCRGSASGATATRIRIAQYGRIKVPLFELVGWEAKDRVVAALAETGLTPDELPPTAVDRSSDMDDDIPF